MIRNRIHGAGAGRSTTRKPTSAWRSGAYGSFVASDTFWIRIAALWLMDVNSNFNSLQVKVEKRLSRGFSVLGSYMFSKAIANGRGESGSGGVGSDLPQNPRNYRAERSVADRR